MSVLSKTIMQFKELEDKYLSHGDKTLNRFTFLEELFGVDLNKKDYSSFTELKAYLRQVAEDSLTEQEMLTDALELLQSVETILKNYNNEVVTMPSGFRNIEDIDRLVSMTKNISVTNTRSADPKYFEKARYKQTSDITIHTLTDMQASRIKPQESIGVQIGGILSHVYTFDENDKVIHIDLKDKGTRVWKKQFYSFATSQDAIDLTDSANKQDNTEASNYIKVIRYMIENKLSIRNELFINAKKEDVEVKDSVTIINYKLGNSKQSAIKHKEVIPGLLYRVARAHINPLTRQKLDAWIVVN